MDVSVIITTKNLKITMNLHHML